MGRAKRKASAEAAVAAVERYLDAFNARDEVEMTAALVFPQVRVGRGGVRVWKSAAEYRGGFDFDAFSERLGWERSEADSMEAIQIGARGVNVAVRITRYDTAPTAP